MWRVMEGAALNALTCARMLLKWQVSAHHIVRERTCLSQEFEVAAGFKQRRTVHRDGQQYK